MTNAKDKAALLKMRKICLSLPNTREGTHFGESVFRVGTRIFASCGEKTGRCRLVFQLEPAHARKLVESDNRFEPYSRQAHCVSMDAGDVKTWTEVRALVLESYGRNARNKPTTRPKVKKKPKAKRDPAPRTL